MSYPTPAEINDQLLKMKERVLVFGYSPHSHSMDCLGEFASQEEMNGQLEKWYKTAYPHFIVYGEPTLREFLGSTCDLWFLKKVIPNLTQWENWVKPQPLDWCVDTRSSNFLRYCFR